MKVEFDMYCGKKRQKFWLCYVKGQGNPFHKYYSLEDAQRGAERLAKENLADVFVMEASKVCSYLPPLPPLPYIQWQDIINFNEKEGE